MKKIILAALFCALAAAAGAQNTVLSIRKEYQEVHEWLQRMTPDEEMVKFEKVIQRALRLVSNRTHKY